MGSTPLVPDRPDGSAVPVLGFPGGASCIAKRAHTESFLLAETCHAPNQRLLPHRHENATITLLLEGVSQESAPSVRAMTCRVGSALVRPAGAIHEDRFGPDGTTNLEIEVCAGTLDALRRATPLFDAHSLKEAPDLPVLAR
jgi:hypothetical protein